MKFNLSFLAFLIVSTVTITAKSQELNNNLKTFDKQAALEGFNSFRDSLEKIHPALYRYNSKKIIDKLFDSCKNDIATRKDITELDFYMVLRFLTSAIQDGHSATTLEKDFMDQQFEQAKVFPLNLYFTPNNAYSLCSYSTDISGGTEIISINNKSVTELRKILFKYIVSDGAIETKKYLDFSDGAFPFLYYWLYGEQSFFNVKYKSKEGKIKEIRINAEKMQNRDCQVNQDAITEYLKLEILNKNQAVLSIKTFDINRLNEDENYFAKFLDSAFFEINKLKITKLIIDLRDNRGGEDSYGALLYSYLTDKPFRYYESLQTISYKYPESAHPNLSLQKPNKNNFKGQCFFLINGRSFSTTSEFCAIARSNNRGKFIGTETGGGYYGNTGGEQTRFTLPQTRILVIIPKRKYVLAVKPSKYKNRGIIADYYIPLTITDILNNKDTQLEYAIKLSK